MPNYPPGSGALENQNLAVLTARVEPLPSGQGMNLKAPVSKKQAKKSPKAAARRKSFCARMSGMKKKLTSAKTARDPNSRINKALRKWDC